MVGGPGHALLQQSIWLQNRVTRSHRGSNPKVRHKEIHPYFFLRPLCGRPTERS